MPREGIFARVITGGTVRVGDCLEVLSSLRGAGAENTSVRCV
jgi:MOSC domain-containing protein YiiM